MRGPQTLPGVAALGDLRARVHLLKGSLRARPRRSRSSLAGHPRGTARHGRRGAGRLLHGTEQQLVVRHRRPETGRANLGNGPTSPFLADGQAVLRGFDAIAAKSGKPLRVTSITSDRVNGLQVNVKEPGITSTSTAT